MCFVFLLSSPIFTAVTVKPLLKTCAFHKNRVGEWKVGWFSTGSLHCFCVVVMFVGLRTLPRWPAA